MDIKRFIGECNKSPLLKQYIPISRKTLKETHFLKLDYSLNDLKDLERRLFFIPPIVIRNTTASYKKANREHKDMIHLELLDSFNNQKLLKEVRSALKISPTNSAFMIPNRTEINKIYTNIFPQTISPEYRRWFFSWADGTNLKSTPAKLKYASQIVNESVFGAAHYLLKKWNLPWRYYDAIVELLLFNTIIPADPGISFQYEYGVPVGKKPKKSISFDIDTTKKELIDFIEKDPLNIFKKKYPYSVGRVRKSPRKANETKKILKIYNESKKLGRLDMKIFKDIKDRPEFEHLSLSAIRDRVKKR
ncbi:MAG: hypothetical protein ACSLEX_01380 [Minisyncoccota bacterium]